MLAFPAIPVRKNDGGLRLVVDYHRLNSITPSLPFYMPTIEEVIAKLGGAQYFSKNDLTKGFHQIPIEKNQWIRLLSSHHLENFAIFAYPSI